MKITFKQIKDEPIETISNVAEIIFRPSVYEILVKDEKDGALHYDRWKYKIEKIEAEK